MGTEAMTKKMAVPKVGDDWCRIDNMKPAYKSVDAIVYLTRGMNMKELNKDIERASDWGETLEDPDDQKLRQQFAEYLISDTMLGCFDIKNRERGAYTRAASEGLADVATADSIKEVVKETIRTKKYLPSVAELIEAAEGKTAHRSDGLEYAIDLSWEIAQVPKRAEKKLQEWLEATDPSLLSDDLAEKLRAFWLQLFGCSYPGAMLPYRASSYLERDAFEAVMKHLKLGTPEVLTWLDQFLAFDGDKREREQLLEAIRHRSFGQEF